MHLRSENVTPRTCELGTPLRSLPSSEHRRTPPRALHPRTDLLRRSPAVRQFRCEVTASRIPNQSQPHRHPHRSTRDPPRRRGKRRLPLRSGGPGTAGVQGLRWTEGIGRATRVEGEVRVTTTRHVVSVGQIQRWTEGAAVSPSERLKRDWLKAMLKDAGGRVTADATRAAPRVLHHATTVNARAEW